MVSCKEFEAAAKDIDGVYIILRCDSSQLVSDYPTDPLPSGYSRTELKERLDALLKVPYVIV